ncbi:hypothetical protein QYF36_021391 [Acer negundo]|nr:hypothetical protein QYF36_021391 [Acer negundo]
MPCASKKQKGKGVSASGSSVGVRHSNYVSWLEHNLGRALLSERNIYLNNMIGSSIPQQVDAMGWHQFVTTANQINERVVREFYAAMDPKEFENGTPVKARGVDVGFNVQDINMHYGTKTYKELDTGVPKLIIFKRYNLELARQLRRLDMITITLFELAKLLYCVKHHEKLDVGKLIRKAIICAENIDSLVMPFPALITHSRPVATRKRQRRDEAACAIDMAAKADAVAEEDLGTSMETKHSALEARLTAFEKGIVDLTKAIQDSYLISSERQSGAGSSSEHVG